MDSRILHKPSCHRAPRPVHPHHTRLRKEDYNPASVQHGQWCAAMPYKGVDYVTPWELREHYRLTAKYPHQCEKCGSSARVISEQTLARKITEGSHICYDIS